MTGAHWDVPAGGSDPGQVPMMVAPDDAGAYEDVYAGPPPPWEIGRPQAVLRRLVESGQVTGHVLDLGCGTGEHALLAAAAGLTATGLDTSAVAVGMARDKAAGRSLAVRFVVGDAFDVADLSERYDAVLDVGLFHLFDLDWRRALVAGLAGVLNSGGTYHLLAFSDKVPGQVGPRRLSVVDVRDSFAASGWGPVRIEESVLEVTGSREVPAWWVSARRR